MVETSDSSAYHRIHAVIDGLISASNEKQKMAEHLELVALIESDRHLLVGAKALAAYLKQRFTEDTDYVVGHSSFQRVRKWMKKRSIPHEDTGEAIRSEKLGIDVIDAANNPVLLEILKRESGLPSPEALAATKYLAIVSGTREPQRVHFDIGDFMGLVGLEGFDVAKLLGFLVDRYEQQRPHVRDLIAKIKAGESRIIF
jgi:hypothetical protein